MQAQLSQITLGEIVGYLRDLSIVSAIAAAVWKARGMWDHVKDFIDRVSLHMDRVETTLESLATNHLDHISKSLDALVKTDGAQIPTDNKHR